MHDLDNFPTSEIAKKMISMVSPIYDEAYVGKWMYQILGAAIEEASDMIRGLREEAFPDTATEKTLPFWEQAYGIVPKPSATVEERRRAILSKRSFKRPMNPAKLAALIKAATGCDAVVEENVWPYFYIVRLISTSEQRMDITRAREIIKENKQANKEVDLDAERRFRIRLTECTPKIYPIEPDRTATYRLCGLRTL